MHESTMKQPLQATAVALGKPLPWDLYDKFGKVVFKRGFIFHTSASLERIVGMGLLYEVGTGVESPQKPASVASAVRESIPPQRSVRATSGSDSFQAAQDEDLRSMLTSGSGSHLLAEGGMSGGEIFQQIEQCAGKIKDLFLDMLNNIPADVNELHKIVHKVRYMFSGNPDACLGAIHRCQRFPQSQLQPIYAAFLCDMAALALGYEEKDRISLIGAAITANLGMFTYQDKLNNHAGKLSAEQLAQLRTHPAESVRLLKKMGVRDRLWLDIVAQHHERADGGGYPGGLVRAKIVDQAVPLMIADSYLSQVTPRAFREVATPFEAVQSIYAKMPKDKADEHVYLVFIKELGIFPPGLFVSLQNDELGMVTRRNTSDSTHPYVSSLQAADGSPYSKPKVRDTQLSEFHIKSICRPKAPINIDPSLLWQDPRDLNNGI